MATKVRIQKVIVNFVKKKYNNPAHIPAPQKKTLCKFGATLRRPRPARSPTTAASKNKMCAIRILKALNIRFIIPNNSEITFFFSLYLICLAFYPRIFSYRKPLFYADAISQNDHNCKKKGGSHLTVKTVGFPAADSVNHFRRQFFGIYLKIS